jgi:hypothetical protein
MQVSDKTPDAYIAGLDDDVSEQIAALDVEIAQVMSGLERVLWEGRFWGGSEQHIIGYGRYRYTGRSGRSGEWFIVGLAAQKNYITVFVNAVDNGAYVAETYKDRLGKVKVGRSSVSFKRLTDVDIAVLTELVARARELAPSD